MDLFPSQPTLTDAQRRRLTKFHANEKTLRAYLGKKDSLTRPPLDDLKRLLVMELETHGLSAQRAVLRQRTISCIQFLERKTLKKAMVKAVAEFTKLKK